MAEKNDAQQPINIKWPRTGMTGRLNGGDSTVLGLLTKIDPTEEGSNEIEKLSFQLKWKHDVEKIASQGDKKDKKAPTESKSVTINPQPTTI